MSDPTNFRRERIEKLLQELRHEVERGLMENEIDERVQFNFVFPISRKIPDGVVACRFETRPVPRGQMSPELSAPRLRVVE